MLASPFGTVVEPNKICSPSPGIQNSNSLYSLLIHDYKKMKRCQTQAGLSGSNTARDGGEWRLEGVTRVQHVQGRIRRGRGDGCKGVVWHRAERHPTTVRSKVGLERLWYVQRLRLCAQRTDGHPKLPPNLHPVLAPYSKSIIPDEVCSTSPTAQTLRTC